MNKLHTINVVEILTGFEIKKNTARRKNTERKKGLRLKVAFSSKYDNSSQIGDNPLYHNTSSDGFSKQPFRKIKNYEMPENRHSYECFADEDVETPSTSNIPSTYMTVPTVPYEPPSTVIRTISFWELPIVRLVFFLIALGGLYYLLPTFRNHVQKYYDREKMQEVYQILRDFNEGRLNKNQAEFLLKTFFELKKDDIHQILDTSKIGDESF